jgi:molybdopterin-guanine dinucleotide biosynthesis protein
MSYADLSDWFAVIKADNILERLRFQNDMRFAAGFSKEQLPSINMDRQKMSNRYNELMLNDVSTESYQDKKEAQTTWNMLKRMHTVRKKRGV